MSQNSSTADDQKFDHFTIEVGKRVRQARIEAHLNQTELADKLNKKQTSISEIERGKIEITASTLLKIAITLEKPVSYFFPQWIHSIVQPEKNSITRSRTSHLREETKD